MISQRVNNHGIRGSALIDQDSTRVLIERVQRGDDGARNELYRRYQLPVLFLVRVNLGRKLRQKVESWDLVQETLLKSLNDLDSFRFDRDNAFKRYLSVKVQQVIRDHADYFGHYHTGGNPGRNEIDDTQELNYGAIMRGILETGFDGYVAQEFIPTRIPLESLQQAIQICDI